MGFWVAILLGIALCSVPTSIFCVHGFDCSEHCERFLGQSVVEWFQHASSCEKKHKDGASSPSSDRRYSRSLSEQLDLPIGSYSEGDPVPSMPIGPINTCFFEVQARYIAQFLHSSFSNVCFVHELLKSLEQNVQSCGQPEMLLYLTEAACSINEAQSMLSALASYRVGLSSFEEFKRGFCKNFGRAYRDEENPKDEREIVAELRRYFPEKLTDPVELPHILASHYEATKAHLGSSRRNTFNDFFEQKQTVLRQLSNDAADVFSAMTFCRFVHALEQDDPGAIWAKGGSRQSEIIQTSDAMRRVFQDLAAYFGYGKLSRVSSIDKILLGFLKGNPERRRSEPIGSSSPRISPERRLSEDLATNSSFQIVLNRKEDNVEQLSQELQDCYSQLSYLVAGLSQAIEGFVDKMDCDDDKKIVNRALREPPHQFINRHVTIDLFLAGQQPRMYALAFLPKAILEVQTRVLRKDLARILMLQKTTSSRGAWGTVAFLFGDSTSVNKKKYADLVKTMQDHGQFWRELKPGQQRCRISRLQEAVCHWGEDDGLIDAHRESLIRPLEIVNQAMPNSLDKRTMPRALNLRMDRYLEHMIWQLQKHSGT